ncbi:MAG: prolyl-tRNA synthetase associated domain-containing protein [Clostridia bacterium]|nr:prolyl-tRNA synthetase associated domain-containing protein [Clostridia bacterium]
MIETDEIIAFLEKHKIPYTRYDHEQCNTVEEKSALDERLGITAKHCKNIFLTNRQKTSFYLLVMPFEKTFRTAEVSKEIGSSRLSFAPDELLLEMLHCHSGCLSTLSLIYDEKNEIPLVVDRELLNEKALCFHPADDTITLAIDTEVCLKTLYPKLKKSPVFVTVTSPTA